MRCRHRTSKPSAELEALGVRIEAGVDLTSEADVDRLATSLSDTKLDLLINNAGVLTHESLGDLDFE